MNFASPWSFCHGVFLVGKDGCNFFQILVPSFTNLTWLVVSNIFYFHPYLKKLSNLTNIFQMGWFNHQLVVSKNLTMTTKSMYTISLPAEIKLLGQSFSKKMKQKAIGSWSLTSTQIVRH